MAQFDIRPAQSSDLDACANLLAARHQSDCERLPFLDPQYRDAEHARKLIEPLFSNPRADGRIAESGDRVVGFLFGERMLLSPADFASKFIPPHSIAIPVEGHAVARGQEVFPVLRALYGDLAGPWTASGFFVHGLGIPAGDAELQEAWVALGFGRRITAATRATGAAVDARRSESLRIERASPEDIDDVLALQVEQEDWHWRSPIFWPVLPEAKPAVRAFNLNALRTSDVPYFIAYDGGKVGGMQTFLRPGFTPPIVRHATDVYLFEGIVSEQVRGGGLGTALLQHSMAWAASAGYETCTLHFASSNPLGGPFWLGHGFQPVEYSMQHVIDDRIAWARPPGR